MMTKTIICAVICFILGSSRYIFVCLSLELLDCIWNPIFVCLLCSVFSWIGCQYSACDWLERLVFKMLIGTLNRSHLHDKKWASWA